MAILLIAVLSLALVGTLDYLTGYQISFSVFYLVPVGVAAWYAGRYWGILFAVLSSVTWYFLEIAVDQPYDHPAIPVWNASVRLTFFLLTGMLLSSLRERLKIESKLARFDSLTGLLNSRAFTQRLEHDLALNQRTGGALTLAYIDLDNFKQINDRGGHGEGDRQLRLVADTITETIRVSDSAGRLGGDEFAIILPATDEDGAKTLLGKLSQALKTHDDIAQAITCSIGAIVFPPGTASADEAISAADQLMYDAKRSGKDQFVVKGLPPLPPP